VPDQHYENPKLAQIYDLDSGWSADRDFYLALAQKPEQKILDLGCGTGLLCNAYAERNHSVVGADPAPAMLEVARRKPHGAHIEWMQSRAQDFRSDKRFDLIIMTGHAFQVLLEDEDIRATLAVMKTHLSPGGLVVFESRNPGIDWRSRWDYAIEIELSEGTVIESRRFLDCQNERMTFELCYKFSSEVLVSCSELRFMPFLKVKDLAEEAGLQLDNFYGDWDKKPFDSSTSEEMIFLFR